MTSDEIRKLIQNQREYLRTGETLPTDKRIAALKKLKSVIQKYEQEIHNALKQDLGKSEFESYMCETGLTLSELSHMIEKTETYAGEKKVHTPLAQFRSRSFIKPSPYGVVLIMSPWNYPFLLTMEPLTDAIAAGNTAILKPSAYSPCTSTVIEKIIRECFEPEFVTVVTGGREENSFLLEEHFDYIFFTGSQTVGREVLRHAAEYLTPVTLELGGKSPCIVDRTADIALAAKRIVFGKFLNCGQTCVAPDYILCDIAVQEKLVKAIRKQIIKQFGKEPLKNQNYGRIINQKHFDRILRLIDKEKVVHGGHSDVQKLQIEPTVMNHVTYEDAVMQEEIFGPVLPILSFDRIDAAIDKVNAQPHPLALYLFSSDRNNQKKIMSEVGFGGGCINDTIIHLATSNMGFGGFGESGMGAYHGKTGFDTFSHYKSIVDKKTWIDLPMRYQPYRKLHGKIIRKFMKFS